MKLYATTTSERATKGQGGNKEILIDLKIENPERKRFAMLKLTNYTDSFELAIMQNACDWQVIKKEQKAKKQKA
jgi:hypothetical protein